MSETVTVPLAALRALVQYAAAMKWGFDSEFVCSASEQADSDRDFAAAVGGLGVAELLDES